MERMYRDYYEQKQMEKEQAEKSNKNKNKGFASMPIEQRKEIARKGGLAVSQNREWMATIGRKGGQAVTKEQHVSAGKQGGRGNKKK